MKLTTIFTIVTLASLTFACKNNKNDKKKEQDVLVVDEVIVDTKGDAIETEEMIPIHQEKKHWSYQGETGPEHWVEFEKDSDCGGKYQSPINIVSTNAMVDTTLQPLDIHYSSATKIHEVVNNGHSIQYNFESGNYLNYKDEKYELKQIHFHEAAEHTINGIRYPMVIHMVHVNIKNQYAVLAVMVKEGKSSAPFNFLESYLPIEKGTTKTVNTSFDLNKNLPKDKGYYNYVGSLTTPPCTEGVNWFIYKKPITISLKQVKELQKIMPLNNYRNEQPLNGRKVSQTK